MAFTPAERIVLHLAAAALLLLALSAGVAAWWLWGPLEPVITWSGGRIVPPIARAGDTVTVSREFRLAQAAQLTISRQLVSYQDGWRLIASKTDLHDSYPAGQHRQHRELRLPDMLPPGTYWLENKIVVHHATPLRDQVLESPRLKVEVVP